METQDLSAGKMYYAIGEVSKMTDISIPTLRLWEKEFDVIRPKKNRKGDRFFTVKDIDNIKTIKHLVKERGYTVDGAKKIMASEYKAARSKHEALESLRNIRSFLVSLRDAIDQRANKTSSASPTSATYTREIVTEESESFEIYGDDMNEKED